MAREAWKGSGQVAAGRRVVRRSATAWARPSSPATTTTEGTGEVLAMVAGRRARSTSAATGETVEVLFDRTPFYAESGGQAGDTGEIEWPTAARARVADVQKQAGDLHVHDLEILEGALSAGDRVQLAVDAERRADHPRQPLGHPPAARGAAQRAGPAT